MNYEKWLQHNTQSLEGKTVAITGSTGGLGRELCIYLATLKASLILLDRNNERSIKFADFLKDKYSINVDCINIQLDDISSVKTATEKLLKFDIDYFIHNAGAYSIPRKICETGYDNVFQINFVSPYYIIKKLFSSLKKKNGRVVVVSSIAHNYSKLNINDIDFKNCKKASLVYGNSKRFLTFALHKLFQHEERITLSVTHPGITFTNITAHYPKIIFTIIKQPMKIIFHSKKKAALSILSGLFNKTEYNTWIGPKFFNVWGTPSKKNINTANESEIVKIFKISEEIYNKINKE